MWEALSFRRLPPGDVSVSSTVLAVTRPCSRFVTPGKSHAHGVWTTCGPGVVRSFLSISVVTGLRLETNQLHRRFEARRFSTTPGRSRWHWNAG